MLLYKFLFEVIPSVKVNLLQPKESCIKSYAVINL